MIGVQLADVAGNGTSADFNTFLSTTCTPGTYGDGSDGTMNNAPIITIITIHSIRVKEDCVIGRNTPVLFL